MAIACVAARVAEQSLPGLGVVDPVMPSPAPEMASIDVLDEEPLPG